MAANLAAAFERGVAPNAQYGAIPLLVAQELYLKPKGPLDLPSGLPGGVMRLRARWP